MCIEMSTICVLFFINLAKHRYYTVRHQIDQVGSC